MGRLISPQELSQDRIECALTLVIDGQVYDFSAYVHHHPGGISPVLKHAGGDATASYSEVHSASLVWSTLPPDKHLGALSTDQGAAIPAALGHAGRSRLHQSHEDDRPAAHGPSETPAATKATSIDDLGRSSPSPTTTSRPRPRRRRTSANARRP